MYKNMNFSEKYTKVIYCRIAYCLIQYKSG